MRSYLIAEADVGIVVAIRLICAAADQKVRKLFLSK